MTGNELENSQQNLQVFEDSAANAPASEFQRIEFTGTARDYFGIWIVNVLLTLATLGIYSAWAKVRRLTYFRNNTKIAGYGFSYHATGLQIFKGRLVAFVILLTLSLVANFQPLVAIFVWSGILFLTPWLLNSSLKFNARMTSYRNVRFNWHGTYWKSFWWLVIAPLVGLLSLGLLTPLFSKHYYRYFASQHSYGTTRFQSDPTAGSYYLAFLLGVILPTAVLGSLITALVLLIPFEIRSSPEFIPLVFLLPVIMLATAVFSMSFIYRVLCRNIMVKTLTLSEVMEFNSDIHPGRFIWISLSNLVAVVVTIGLLLPWATVRIYRYLAECTQTRIHGDMNQFVDDARVLQSSFGQEFADFEGIDVSI